MPSKMQKLEKLSIYKEEIGCKNESEKN